MVSKMMTICILFCFLLSFKAQDVYGDEPVPGTGDILQLAIPAVAWGSTFAYGDSEGRNQFYKSAAACLAITHGLKFAVGEQRPNGHFLPDAVKRRRIKRPSDFCGGNRPPGCSACGQNVV
jgi:hypothetical protein